MDLTPIADAVASLFDPSADAVADQPPEAGSRGDLAQELESLLRYINQHWAPITIRRRGGHHRHGMRLRLVNPEGSVSHLAACWATARGLPPRRAFRLLRIAVQIGLLDRVETDHGVVLRPRPWAEVAAGLGLGTSDEVTR